MHDGDDTAAAADRLLADNSPPFLTIQKSSPPDETPEDDDVFGDVKSSLLRELLYPREGAGAPLVVLKETLQNNVGQDRQPSNAILSDSGVARGLCLLVPLPVGVRTTHSRIAKLYSGDVFERISFERRDEGM